jgi:hypothetical protein
MRRRTPWFRTRTQSGLVGEWFPTAEFREAPPQLGEAQGLVDGDIRGRDLIQIAALQSRG